MKQNHQYYIGYILVVQFLFNSNASTLLFYSSQFFLCLLLPPLLLLGRLLGPLDLGQVPHARRLPDRPQLGINLLLLLLLLPTSGLRLSRW